MLGRIRADGSMAVRDKLDRQRLLGGAAILGFLALAWAIERPFRGSRASDRGPQAPQSIAHARPGGDEASSPARPPAPWSWSWWKRVGLKTYRAMNEDRLVAVAAGVVFYALLAIFPAIAAFVSFYGLIANPETIGRHLDLLSNVLPPGGLDLVHEQVNRIAGRSAELSFGFAAGLAVAIWSANAGVKAMIDALNVIEDRDERRSFVGLNALSLSFTLGAIVFLIVAVGAVVAFPVAMSAFGVDRMLDVPAGLLRWPALLLVAGFAIAMLYRFGPCGMRRRGRFITTGVFVAALAWLVGSAALSFYMSHFADYNATYGSLGAGVGLMMWMWVSAIAVLLGAEIDTVIDRMARSDREPLVERI
jgi:membrane protein